MQASIRLPASPRLQYLLRIADACLVHSQRLGEWCGHAPVLEEDIAMANIALDLLGQARALYAHVGSADGVGLDEDQLAFLRDERDYRNPTLVELPHGSGAERRDFAFTVVRNAIVATWLELLWQRLTASSDAQVAAIAGKAVKEARYHQRHAGDWLVRLGDGSDESHRRCGAALAQIWRFTPELVEDDEIDRAAAQTGLGPAWSELAPAWRSAVEAMIVEATLTVPAPSAYRSNGKRGLHSEHMGYLLAEMQHLQRTFPAGVW